MRRSVSIVLLCLLYSCVEPYDRDFETTKKIIIVEGLISNDFQTDPILLKESLTDNVGSRNIQNIIGAKAFIIVNNSTKFPLTEKEEGNYYVDSTFKGVVGNTYRLEFTTIDGTLYSSTDDKILDPVDIQGVSSKLENEAFSTATGKKSPGHYFYIDYKDPANAKNQYLWQWKIFEKQNVCATCTGGYYFAAPLPYGICRPDPILSRFGNIFDYRCTQDCWEIVTSQDMIVNNDQNSNGNLVKNQQIGRVPMYSLNGALLDINQYSISDGAYKFIKLSQNQSVLTGSLADTPPAALVGNIRCITNPNINTSGYFLVAGKSTKRYWLDRQEAFNLFLPTVGLLGGRAVRYEPSGRDTTRPPLAPCVNSKKRTNNKPAGWQE